MEGLDHKIHDNSYWPRTLVKFPRSRSYSETIGMVQNTSTFEITSAINDSKYTLEQSGKLLAIFDSFLRTSRSEEVILEFYLDYMNLAVLVDDLGSSFKEAAHLYNKYYRTNLRFILPPIRYEAPDSNYNLQDLFEAWSEVRDVINRRILPLMAANQSLLSYRGSDCCNESVLDYRQLVLFLRLNRSAHLLKLATRTSRNMSKLKKLKLREQQQVGPSTSNETQDSSPSKGRLIWKGNHLSQMDFDDLDCSTLVDFKIAAVKDIEELFYPSFRQFLQNILMDRML